jgi:thiamine-phosphate pyrophosphorylase
LRAAIREGADYVGIGPVFPTTTKDAGPCLGMEAFSRLIPTVTVPSFAIGGIDADNIGELADAGASGVAVCSAILGTPNAEASGQATRDLRVALERRAAEPGLS